MICRRGIVPACCFPFSSGPPGSKAKLPGPPAFRALKGREANAFRVPSDVRRVSVERAGRAAQVVAERYQQFLGAAEVLGGQLTRYRDETDLSVVVVGAHYPDLAASNAIRIAPREAQAVAASRRPAETEPGIRV